MNLVLLPDTIRSPVDVDDFISLCGAIRRIHWYDEMISIQHPDFFTTGAIFSFVPHTMKINYSGFGNRPRGIRKIVT